MMSPWIPIAVSAIGTIIMGLVGFIVKRELGRQTKDFADVKDAYAKIDNDLRVCKQTCEGKFLTKEMFNTLEKSRKEIEELRREQDKRLENLIQELLKKLGGGRWWNTV